MISIDYQQNHGDCPFCFTKHLAFRISIAFPIYMDDLTVIGNDLEERESLEHFTKDKGVWKTDIENWNDDLYKQGICLLIEVCSGLIRDKKTAWKLAKTPINLNH